MELVPTFILILVVVVIAGAFCWAIRQLSAAFGWPTPVATVAQVAIVLIALLWLVSRLLPGLRL